MKTSSVLSTIIHTVVMTMSSSMRSFSTSTIVSYTPKYTYKLGPSTLYIPLTSKCNSKTLPQLRGPNFMLPANVVAALCRVRDVESRQEKWNSWCTYLDTQEDEGGRYKLPPPDSEPVAELSGQQERQPKVVELFHETQQQLFTENNDNDAPTCQIKCIVFAGEGEPTLRLHDMLYLAKQIHESTKRQQSMPSSIRLTTNGLLMGSIGMAKDNSVHDIMKQFVDHGITQISVGLLAHDAKQYEKIMQPVLLNCDVNPHELVCEFIQEATKIDGLDVEVTAIEQTGIDKTKTEELAKSLGVTSNVRWRPYFP